MKKSEKSAKTLTIQVIISIVLFLVILFILFNLNFNLPLDTETIRPAASYPPAGTEYVAVIGIVLLSAYIFMIDRFFINKLTMKKKIFANIIVVIVFFLVLEVSLHHYSDRHNRINFLPHPLLLWARTRNVNKMGFSYPEFPIKKETGELRFVLVGDSNAEGQLDTRFSDLTEKELQKLYPHRNIRLINAACSGYSIVQVYNLVKLKIFSLNPDYIIISLNNDPTYDSQQDKSRLPPPSLVPLLNVLYKSNIYLLLRKSKLNRDYRLFDHDDDFKKAHNTQRVHPEDVDRYYGDLIKEAQKRGIKILIMAMPTLYHDERSRQADYDYKKHLGVIAEKWDVFFLDLFSPWQKEDNAHLFIDYLHTTEEGHKKIAEDLVKFIKENIIK